MGHHDAPSDTVYDHGEMTLDDLADETWTDEKTERMNLRMPPWMFEEIENRAQFSRYNDSPQDMARAMLEYALANMEDGDLGIFGKHTYGDCKCPVCGEQYPPNLRYFGGRSSVDVTCMTCEFEDELATFRECKDLDDRLDTIWTEWRLENGDWREMSEDHVKMTFDQFLTNPRDVVERTDWREEVTPVDRERTGDHAPESRRDRVYRLLKDWETDE